MRGSQQPSTPTGLGQQRNIWGRWSNWVLLFCFCELCLCLCVSLSIWPSLMGGAPCKRHQSDLILLFQIPPEKSPLPYPYKKLTRARLRKLPLIVLASTVISGLCAPQSSCLLDFDCQLSRLGSSFCSVFLQGLVQCSLVHDCAPRYFSSTNKKNRYKLFS